MKTFLIVDRAGRAVILLGDRAMAERWLRETGYEDHRIVEMILYTDPKEVFDL